MAASSPAASRRIPSLDGLRAISIALVIVGHVAPELFSGSTLMASVFAFGNLGVRTFFVISGFLITGLLLAELETYGRIDLLRFYARRAFRIFPAFYVFLLAIVAWHMLGDARPDRLFFSCALRAASYVSNYGTCVWDVGHTWSLSVEEQFYLLWPATLVLLSRRTALRVAAGCVVLVPVVRFVMVWTWPEIDVTYRFETVCDALAAGCLLAAAHRSGRFTQARLFASRWFVLIPLAMLVLHEVGPHPSLYMNQAALFTAVAPTLMNLGVAACLEWCMRRPNGSVGRLLNSTPLTIVGAMSYSIYLWQQPFTGLREAGHWWSQLPWRLVWIAIASLGSFYLIERPVLRLRDRLMASRRPTAAAA